MIDHSRKRIYSYVTVIMMWTIFVISLQIIGVTSGAHDTHANRVINAIDKQFHLRTAFAETDLRNDAIAADLNSEGADNSDLIDSEDGIAEVRQPFVAHAMNDEVAHSMSQQHSIVIPTDRIGGGDLTWIVVVCSSGILVIFISILLVLYLFIKRADFPSQSVQTVLRGNNVVVQVPLDHSKHFKDDIRSPISMFYSGGNDEIKTAIMSIPSDVMIDKAMFVRTPSIDQNCNVLGFTIEEPNAYSSDDDTTSRASIQNGETYTIRLSSPTNSSFSNDDSSPWGSNLPHSSVSTSDSSIISDDELTGLDYSEENDNRIRTNSCLTAVEPITDENSNIYPEMYPNNCYSEHCIAETSNSSSSDSYIDDDIQSICCSDFSVNSGHLEEYNFESIESWKNYTNSTPMELIEDVDGYLPNTLKSRPSLQFYTDDSGLTEYRRAV